MKAFSWRKAAAAVAIAGGAVLMAPAAAQAAYPIPPGGQIMPAATVAPGASVTYGFVADALPAGTEVVFSLTGENATSQGFAIVSTVVNTSYATKTAMSGMATTVTFTPTASASGVYTIAASVNGTPVGSPASVTVTAASGGGGSQGGLTPTGSNETQLLWLWVGGGALALAGGGLVVANSVRKQRRAAE